MQQTQNRLAIPTGKSLFGRTMVKNLSDSEPITALYYTRQLTYGVQLSL